MDKLIQGLYIAGTTTGAPAYSQPVALGSANAAMIEGWLPPRALPRSPSRSRAATTRSTGMCSITMASLRQRRSPVAPALALFGAITTALWGCDQTSDSDAPSEERSEPCVIDSDQVPVCRRGQVLYCGMLGGQPFNGSQWITGANYGDIQAYYAPPQLGLSMSVAPDLVGDFQANGTIELEASGGRPTRVFVSTSDTRDFFLNEVSIEGLDTLEGLTHVSEAQVEFRLENLGVLVLPCVETGCVPMPIEGYLKGCIGHALD